MSFTYNSVWTLKYLKYWKGKIKMAVSGILIRKSYKTLILPNCAFLNNIFESILTSVYKYMNILKPESNSSAKYILFSSFLKCFWSAFKHIDRTPKITWEETKFLSKKLRDILKEEIVTWPAHSCPWGKHSDSVLTPWLARLNSGRKN